MLEGLRESLVLITALVSPDSMLSLVSLNSEFERNENIANARAMYHSQTATALTVKPYPPRASLFSAPSASALCCGCRECRTHGRTKANTALAAEAGSRAASVHVLMCVRVKGVPRSWIRNLGTTCCSQFDSNTSSEAQAMKLAEKSLQMGSEV